MKKFYLPLAIVLLFVACTPQTYYQLIETDYDKLETSEENLKYENSDILITYNFWRNGGNGSFTIYNKTDSDIFIDLKRSHLIINGYAFTYFQNREFASPRVSFFSPATDDEIKEKRSIKLPGVTPKNIPEQALDITTFNEERIICIPPKSKQTVFGFNLVSDVYRNCQLLRFPKSREVTSSEFTFENSPLIYRNRIAYDYNEDCSDPKFTENVFWAKKITNYPSMDFKKDTFTYTCDSSELKTVSYPYKSVSSFYYEYKLEPSSIRY